MITIYATLKGMDTEQKTVMQRNAVQSWLKLDPKPQIIILGDELGVKELCQEFGLQQVIHLPCAPSGAPYFDHFTRLAREAALYDTMLLVSADIILGQDTIEATKAVKKQLPNGFCVCARKQNIAMKLLDFSKENWMDDIEKQDWNLWAAGDYFLHHKDFLTTMPRFIAGRSSVDNWMFKLACHHNYLVDATGSITVLHHNHGERLWDMQGIPHEEHPEVQHNRKMYQDHDIKTLPKWGYVHYIGINYANWLMEKDFSLTENLSPNR